MEAAAAFRAAAARPALPDALRIVALLEGASALRRLDRPQDALQLLDAAIRDPASTAFDLASARWLAPMIRRDLGDGAWTRVGQERAVVTSCALSFFSAEDLAATFGCIAEAAFGIWTERNLV